MGIWLAFASVCRTSARKNQRLEEPGGWGWVIHHMCGTRLGRLEGWAQWGLSAAQAFIMPLALHIMAAGLRRECPKRKQVKRVTRWLYDLLWQSQTSQSISPQLLADESHKVAELQEKGHRLHLLMAFCLTGRIHCPHYRLSGRVPVGGLQRPWWKRSQVLVSLKQRIAQRQIAKQEPSFIERERV
jgi:hypothetical protein